MSSLLLFLKKIKNKKQKEGYLYLYIILVNVFEITYYKLDNLSEILYYDLYTYIYTFLVHCIHYGKRSVNCNYYGKQFSLPSIIYNINLDELLI